VPHPAAGPLYVRLRDDPAVSNLTLLDTQLLAPSQKHSDEADPAAERNHTNP